MTIFPYFVLLILLCSCSSTGTQVIKQRPSFSINRDYQANFDTVWKATLRAVEGFPLNLIEKDSGILETDWTQYVDYVKVSAWRGLLYGGRVEENAPIEVMHKLKILVISKSNNIVNVKIIRFVKIRAYLQTEGPKGNWTPNTLMPFEQVQSDTIQENKLLNEIETLLAK